MLRSRVLVLSLAWWWGGCTRASDDASPTITMGASSSGGGTDVAEDPCATFAPCSDAPEAAAAPMLLVGTGKTCFVEPGTPALLPIVSGPQGGYHVWVALRDRGFGSHPTLTLHIDDEQGSVALVDPMVRQLATCPIGNGWAEAPHLFGFLAAHNPVAAGILVGTTATLRASLDDGTAHSEATLPFTFGDVVVDAHH